MHLNVVESEIRGCEGGGNGIERGMSVNEN
jgi:hypothetical protein